MEQRFGQGPMQSRLPAKLEGPMSLLQSASHLIGLCRQLHPSEPNE